MVKEFVESLTAVVRRHTQARVKHNSLAPILTKAFLFPYLSLKPPGSNSALETKSFSDKVRCLSPWVEWRPPQMLGKFYTVLYYNTFRHVRKLSSTKRMTDDAFKLQSAVDVGRAGLRKRSRIASSRNITKQRDDYEGRQSSAGWWKFRKRQKLAKIVYHVCQTLEENGQASLTVTFCALPALSHQTLFSLCADQARGRRSTELCLQARTAIILSSLSKRKNILILNR